MERHHRATLHPAREPPQSNSAPSQRDTTEPLWVVVSLRTKCVSIQSERYIQLHSVGPRNVLLSQKGMSRFKRRPSAE